MYDVLVLGGLLVLCALSFFLGYKFSEDRREEAEREPESPDEAEGIETIRVKKTPPELAHEVPSRTLPIALQEHFLWAKEVQAREATEDDRVKARTQAYELVWMVNRAFNKVIVLRGEVPFRMVSSGAFALLLFHCVQRPSYVIRVEFEEGME